MKSEIAADRAIYLYAVSSSTASRRVLGVAGVDGLAPIEAVPAGALMCWISLVDGSEYGEQLERNMENLEWLATSSVRHQQAVAEIATMGEVLPARFGTVFLSLDSLFEHIKQNEKDLVEALNRVSGCDEWGIKVFAEARRAQAGPTEAASGSEYLKKKASQLRSRGPREDREVTALVGDVAQIARATAASGKISSGQPGLVWQGAFLVQRKDRKKLQAILERYAAKWSPERRIDYSGPWPPYSFVSVNGK